MAVPINNTLDFLNASKGINLVNPTNPQDAATKIYVDQSVTNISGGMIAVNEYNALTTSAGNWVPNDVLIRFQVLSSTGTITSTIWYTNNGTTLSTIPVIGTDVEDGNKTDAASLKSIVANQTSGTQKAISRGAAKGVTVAGDITSTAQSADRQALDVQVRNSLGSAIDKFPTTFSADNQDIYNHLIVGQRLLQLNLAFFGVPPASLLNITTTGTATATQGSGMAVFATGTGTTSSIKAVTPLTLNYTPQYELFSSFSAIFTAPTSAASSQRLGAYSTTDGFSYGYNGLTFGLWSRFNTADTFVAQSSWNVDPCQGGASSLFTRNGVPEALDPTKTNIYRVRFGWHGAAPLVYEILNPDGQYIRVHILRPANNQTTPSMISPNVPITLEITKTASDATNLVVSSPAWSGGTSSPETTSFTGYGTLTAAATAVLMPTSAIAGLSISISGTWVGTLTFQETVDGINWINDTVLSAVAGTFVTTTTGNGTFETNVGSYRGYRVFATAFTSGTAVIAYSASSGSAITATQAFVSDPLNNNTISIKPASTAAVATDTALVVAVSPNNALTVNNSRSTLIGYTTTSTASNTNLLDPSGAGAYTDVRNYNSAILVITFPAGTTTYTIQGSLYNTQAPGTNFSIDTYSAVGIKLNGTQTNTGAGTIKVWVPLADSSYLRLSTSNTSPSGVFATAYFSNAPFQVPGNLINHGVPTPILDLSGTQTANFTTAAIAIPYGCTTRFDLNVTNIAGTAPVDLSITIQESYDGTTWRDLYTFPAFDGNYQQAGALRSPNLATTANLLRYNGTVIGTGASFTFTMYRTHSNQPGDSLQYPKRINGFNAASTAVDIPANGRITKAVISNSTATVYYLQIHRTASGGASTLVAAGATPAEVHYIPASATLRLGVDHFSMFGANYFSSAPAFSYQRVVISSTFATYTAISTTAKALFYAIETI